MTNVAFAFGDVWWADVAYEEIDGSKTRPVLVMREDDKLCVFALKMTSHPPRDDLDYELQDWKSVGLSGSSIVRVSKLLHLERAQLLSRIGRLTRADSIEVKKLIALRLERHIKPKQTFEEALAASVKKTIRECTPEKARKALSKISGYDENGNFIED